MKRQSNQIDYDDEHIQSLKKISAMISEYFKDQDKDKKCETDPLDDIWDPELDATPSTPDTQPVTQPTAQVAPCQKPAFAEGIPAATPKKTGMFRHGIQIWHPVMVDMCRVVPPARVVSISGRVPQNALYGADLQGKHPTWAYRVPRWLTIEQARKNTPDKWAKMCPPDWRPYE